MIIIQHRVNDLDSLIITPTSMGVEIDVRSNSNELYLSHDPFVPGVSLEMFLKSYNHSLLVLNIKEDGLEERCLELLVRHEVRSYFFLDQPAPSLIRRGLRGNRDGACRYSEYEHFESVSLMAKFCDWVWVDFFHASRLDTLRIASLVSLGLKICVVSPELHSKDRVNEVSFLVESFQHLGFIPDAVCTKFPELWLQL
jgi:hypothetical protein